ncbi:unnamed protein product [Camellia sinensis]
MISIEDSDIRSSIEAPDLNSDPSITRISSLNRLMEDPAAYGKLGLANLLELREDCLREFYFADAYRSIKQRENEASLAVLPDLLMEIDSMNEETRLLTLIEGVLAANIFDWGSRACVDLYHKGTIIEIYRMSRKKMQRPWRGDDFDLFKERMLGSGDKKPPPHKRALLFVDNSGVDVILGMLPLARELLRRGTEVVLVANSLPVLNDVTAMELPDIVAEAAKSISTEQTKRFTKFRERKGLIDEDVVRTDRSLSFYDGDDNPNVNLLRDILLTYSFYNFDLGYSQIVGQLKSLQLVASLTAERDGEIQKAALNTLATCYKTLGCSTVRWKLQGAYDKAAIKCNGREAVTNFEASTYEEELSSEIENRGSSHNLDLNLGISTPYFANGQMGSNDLSSGLHLQSDLSNMHENRRAENSVTTMGIQLPHGQIMVSEHPPLWKGSFEALNQRAVAVVVDPIQSVKGKVVIDAFRLINPQTMMLGQEPRQTTSNLGHLNKPSIQALIHGLNRHYYSIAINYRKNELEEKMLLNLHKKKWTDGLTLQRFDTHSKTNEQTVQMNKNLERPSSSQATQKQTRGIGYQKQVCRKGIVPDYDLRQRLHRV